MGVLLLGATLVAATVAAIAAVAAGYFRRPAATRATQIGVVGWSATYAALLFGTSVASTDRLLSPGEVKRFCGMYLDCHLGASVVDVRRVAALGRPPHQTHAAGEFVVVTLRIESNAVRATLALDQPRVVLVDDGGRAFQRTALGERALAITIGAGIPLDHPVPAGAYFTTPVVFDVAADATNLRLHMTEGSAAARVVERFLVGDEDSVLHGRIYHSLVATGRTIAEARD